MGLLDAARRPSLEVPAHSDPNRVGRYLIKEELAAGGMGIVYRAVDKPPARSARSSA